MRVEIFLRFFEVLPSKNLKIRGEVEGSNFEAEGQGLRFF